MSLLHYRFSILLFHLIFCLIGAEVWSQFKFFSSECPLPVCLHRIVENLLRIKNNNVYFVTALNFWVENQKEVMSQVPNKVPFFASQAAVVNMLCKTKVRVVTTSCDSNGDYAYRCRSLHFSMTLKLTNGKKNHLHFLY